MALLIRLAAVFMTVGSLGATAGEMHRLDDRRPAPILELRDMKDTPVSLWDYRGNIVLVNFWASWCPPCLVEMPGMERLAKALDGTPFVILAVNVGESKHKAFRALSMMDFTQRVLLDRDGKAAKAWRVGVYPTSYLVDRAGRLRYEVLGPLEWDGTEAMGVIEQLVEEPASDDGTVDPVVLGSDHRNHQPELQR